MSDAVRGEIDGRRLSGALLAGKLVPPQRRGGAVSRETVITTAREAGSAIVGVSAPAGYGKSTMLAEWAATEDRPVVWVTVDRFDDDPAALLTLIAIACAAVSSRAKDIVDEMHGVGAAMLGRSAPMLASALAAADTPFVLFIDDIHNAASVDCEDVLEVVLAGVPHGSQVVLASRRELAYLARLRAGGAVHDIGPDDLRIDHAGARAIFADAAADVSDEQLAVALDRCEGWATGLFLCALAAGSGSDALSVAGDERFVADYLYRECLDRLPGDLQAFLRRTAVLDEISAEVCDAMLGIDDAQAMLRTVESLRLFIIPLDGRRRWFRYHALFREFLLAELHRVEAGTEPSLHRAAADWFEACGETARAVEHLLAAGDQERAPVLMEEVALQTYQRGEVSVVSRWLSSLGDAAVEAYPPLAVIAAWTAILLGQSPASERWAGILDRIDVSDAPEPDRVAFESARAMVRAAMCVDGPQRALADATFAVEHEPDWSPWRDQALHLLGSALLLVGDRAGARNAFLEASACAAEQGNADSILLSEAELAILALEDGAWADAERHAGLAVRAVDDNHMEGYPTTALALAVSARLAQHRGDLVMADANLARAMRARVHCTHVLPYLAMRTRLQLAKLFAARGDRAAARHMLYEIDALRRRRPHVGVLADEVEGFRSKLSEASNGTATLPLTPAELRLLPYLQTHLTIGEIGQRLFVTRNTVSSEVGSIYRKLGVTTRSAAVDKALSVGLLGS